MGMPKGYKHSEETKARMAAASAARWADPEYRARLAAKHKENAAKNGSAQQKKAAEASAKHWKGRKRSPEQTARSVAVRRDNNGGRYWPEGGGPCVNMEAEPAREESMEYTGDHPEKSEARRRGVIEGRGVGWKQTPEARAKISEAKRRQWAEGVYANKKPATRRRVSKMELSLIPYLEPLGYRHVDAEHKFFIYHPEKGMVPDFVDRKNKRVFEFFGDFWHAPEDEAETIRRYAERGWACTVLWEHDLDGWISSHTSPV